MNSLEEVAQAVRRCTKCPLHQGRANAVPGEGPASAEIMFIGEGPGAQEDRQGRPFVGPAGQFLDGLLASIGLTRQQVYIANMVKCRPPQNREPLPEEIAACRPYLDRQLQLIHPRLIVTLGRISLSRYFPGEGITRVRGKLREKEGQFVYPVMHPAAALHRQELRAAIIEDFKGIPQALEQIRERALLAPAPAAVPEPPVPAAAEEKPPEQLSLF